MKEKSSTLAYALRPGVARRSAAIAFVVGTLLTAANQAGVILREPMTAGLLAKILFNYAVPFVVSSVSAAANRPQE